jgi:hypothetical protein
MLYMLLILPASAAARSTGGAMGGMGASPAGSRFSLLALLLALFLLGWVVWLADQLTLRVPAHRILAPRCAVLCKMAMGITMSYMLILML